MSEAPLMIGVSGLRGITGRSLTPDVASRFAAAFGAWLVERGTSIEPMVVIGHAADERYRCVGDRTAVRCLDVDDPVVNPVD
ncbi:MAG: hypothetical protein IH912_10085 [Proteobacteria bacterium]|nr:hypothetical protein [Pseudomonadota bacterium]